MYALVLYLEAILYITLLLLIGVLAYSNEPKLCEANPLGHHFCQIWSTESAKCQVVAICWCRKCWVILGLDESSTSHIITLGASISGLDRGRDLHLCEIGPRHLGDIIDQYLTFVQTVCWRCYCTDLYSTIGSARNIWWTCLRARAVMSILLGGWLFVPHGISSGVYTFGWCWFSHFPMNLPVQGTVNGAIDSFDKANLQKTSENIGNPAFLEASQSSLHGHLKEPFA